MGFQKLKSENSSSSSQVFLVSSTGSGSGSAFFTALRRRTFGFASVSGSARAGGDRDDGTLVGAEEDVGTELLPKVEVGGTKDSVFLICFSTRFASSDATTELPDPNSDFEGPESELPLKALSILKEPNPSSSSLFLFFFAGGGDLLFFCCSLRR